MGRKIEIIQISFFLFRQSVENWKTDRSVKQKLGVTDHSSELNISKVNATATSALYVKFSFLARALVHCDKDHSKDAHKQFNTNSIWIHSQVKSKNSKTPVKMISSSAQLYNTYFTYYLSTIW